MHYKKHTSKKTTTVEQGVEEALCFGWIDGLLKRIDDQKYTLRYTPRRANSIWSDVNKARVKKLIEQGRMTEAGLEKVRQAKKNGRWYQRTTAKGPVRTPSDLKAALAKDKQAEKNFKNLALSYRRQFIYWITSAKRDETRQKRIGETVRLAKENKKPGMK